jgi:phenylacetic acid degradation operon negative regulatory protein
VTVVPDRDTTPGVDAGVSDVLNLRPAQPRSLIVTLYGMYARESGGWLSVAALIRLMASLGVDEPAVRSSISRLKRRGILVSERQGAAAGYALSAEAREILTEGDRRIFRPLGAQVEEGWVLAVFGVPETERARRHTLRSRLSWLGFGNVGPGVWVAPAHLADETREALYRLELSQYVNLFCARYLGFTDLHEQVARWWDLDELQRRYAEYLETWAPVLARWHRRRRPDPEQAFIDLAATLTAWRRLPYLDPGLPADLLPPGWPGTRAAEVFFALRERLDEPAHEHVRAVRAATN